MKAIQLPSLILQGKCPKCHQGNMFQSQNPFHPKKGYQMVKNCPHCQQATEPEPGFYFGAMFISYAINTAFFIIVWTALTFIYPDYSLTVLLSLLTLTVILLLPLTFRLSRTIWIYIFVKYKPEIELEKQN